MELRMEIYEGMDKGGGVKREYRNDWRACMDGEVDYRRQRKDGGEIRSKGEERSENG